MAERRMFAKTIIDSDAFLDMPATSQLLYFHLSMRADDEGFINNPKSIIRNVGCKDDDIKLLIAKKFIIPFESGVVVIKHWKIHNYIRSDRMHKTKYSDEKAMLLLDENNGYRRSETVLAGSCLSNVRPLPADCHTEDRLSKDREEKEIPPLPPQGFDEFWKVYPKKVGKQAAFKAYQKVKPDAELQRRMLDAIELANGSDQWRRDNGQFIPNPATWLNQGRWDDEIGGLGDGQDIKHHQNSFAHRHFGDVL